MRVGGAAGLRQPRPCLSVSGASLGITDAPVLALAEGQGLTVSPAPQRSPGDTGLITHRNQGGC